MASYAVKLGHQKDIISQMTKEQQSNLSKGLIMVFCVQHIVQQHPDHPDHRITIKMSEKLLDVKIEVFLSHQDSYKFMSDVISNILQLHKDSRGRFLPHRGDGVQLVLSGCLDNKPTPVASEKMFITLFNLYFRHQVRSGYKIDGPFIILIVIDCEIMRCHQFIDLNEAIAWWESMPVSAHDMVPVTNSSSSIYAEYKIRRLLGLSQVMKEVVPGGGLRLKQCSICLEEFPRFMEVTLLHCMHAFHEHCITRWFKESSTCPLCRIVLD